MEQIREILAEHGQEHVLAYFDELSPDERRHLLTQLAAIDWDRFEGWVHDYVERRPTYSLPEDLEPAPYFPLVPDSAAQKEFYEQAAQAGHALLRVGKVAAFTVAGGQGTRLGYDGPKGTLPLSPVAGKSLFQLFAESLARWAEIVGNVVPWYIMTSPLNDAATREFFARHTHFGMDPADIVFLQQGQMPALSYDGKLLLASRGSLAMSPDGHGGSLRALHQSGALADMARRGIEYISYFQVDNPLVSVVDPLFIGLHHLEQAQMSSRMIAKTGAEEKMGVFCKGNGKIQIVEYSDLPKSLQQEVDEVGNLRYIAGSPAIHVISRSFVEDLNQDGFALPIHRADKKVEALGPDGKCIVPAEPNAVKLETFVFDALPLTERTVVLEASRACEFAPVKNAAGADSPASCRVLMQEQFATWLESRGSCVPRTPEGAVDCKLELSARSFVNEEDFQLVEVPTAITSGDEVYIK